MSEEDRLSLLRSLDPAQYHNIMNVVCAMPHITMEIRVEGVFSGIGIDKA